MKEDECGYIYPEVNQDKCVNCGICQRTCPAKNPIELKEPITCFAARIKDKNILKKSTSGGIAAFISKEIINENGIVYGAAYINNCEVNHIRIDKHSDLSKLQGSKYVHSYIQNSYNSVKNDLEEKKYVAFFGTPCQVAGLKKFLNKEYEKLLLVDIVCHGVPSQKFLKDEVGRINSNLNVDRINFRDKNYGAFTFSIEKNGKDSYSEVWYRSPYYYTFMEGITYRDNCYECFYAKDKRCSDITICDFWGLKEDATLYDSSNEGISAILPITQKGLNFINKNKDNLEIEERTIEEAVNGNTQLRHPVEKTKQADNLRKIYRANPEKGFYYAYNKACIVHVIKQRIKKLISK